MKYVSSHTPENEDTPMTPYGIEPNATAQRVFDHVAKHLFKQARPSSRSKFKQTDSMFCLYRGPNGMACAAGCLMTDDEYDLDMEQIDILGVIENPTWEYLKKGAIGKHTSLVRRLQQIHDDDPLDRNTEYSAWLNTDTMRKALQITAHDFNLSPKILETLSFD